MNILIILGHPNKNSFNHAIAASCKQQLELNGHSVMFHDLYEEKFNPIHHINNSSSELSAQIKLHCSHLATCDSIIIIHPNWWGQPPAIIKGWIDNILLQGVAFDFIETPQGEYQPVGLLKAKFGIVLTTSNTDNNSNNDILDAIWEKNVFNICGVSQVKRLNFGLINNSSDMQRNNWLLEVEQLINSLFPLNN